MSDTRRTPVNEGIQANTVTADVMAVGRHATAQKAVGAAPREEDVSRLLDQLRAGLATLNLQPHAKEAVEAELNNLQTAVKAPEPKADHVAGVMQNLSGKLKMIGVLVSDMAAIGDPLRKMAELFHFHLPG